MKERIMHGKHFDEVGKVHQKYMVVVPRKIRESMGLKIGDKVVWENRVRGAELKPLRYVRKDAVERAYGIAKVRDHRKLEEVMKRVEEEDELEVD